MSIVSTIPVYLLSNSIALNALLSRNYLRSLPRGMIVPREDWQEWARVASLQRDSSRPWNIFEMRWKKFSGDAAHILLYALDCLGEEYLCVRNRRLFVREQEVFARWQNLRGRMSMLPVKFRMQYREGLEMRNRLVHPYSACMADYIQQEGLNECHLHLHACMMPELSWLLALEKLSAYSKQVMSPGARRCRALYTAVHPMLTAEIMLQRMWLARSIRCDLLSLVEGGAVEAVVEHMIELYERFVDRLVVDDDSRYAGDACGDMAILEQQEQMIWKKLFDLAETHDSNAEFLLFFAHLYLLIQNDYLQLCRMNEANKGFDAFQIRAHYSCLGYSLEKYYARAFRQILCSSSVTDNTCIEVRISPRIFWQRGVQLERIWKHCCAAQGKVKPRLILTVHFLKGLGSGLRLLDEEMRVERFANCRKRLKFECGRLVSSVKSLSQRCDIGISIDGAGNELQFPPAVMAPVFRRFERETGISYKTYHCGEDFYHLISGIRAVYEGVEFLELRQGNRIGHATAIGMVPEHWRADMPAVVVMRQGDWLLDLIFMWKMLLEDGHRHVLKIEHAMLPVAMKIFAHALLQVPIHVHSLSSFYMARQLDPETLDIALGCGWEKGAGLHPEEQRAVEFRREFGDCGLKLFRHWLYDRDSIEEQNKLVEVERDFLDTETLLLLQHKVQKLINKRNVVLEALPVSNVRISQYRDMLQHHILRWLGVPGHALPGDEEMTVCIGSDDPGIFVSDIRNEFYHVFSNLWQERLTPDACMKYIRRLNHAGRVYSFREKIVKDSSYEFSDWPHS